MSPLCLLQLVARILAISHRFVPFLFLFVSFWFRGLLTSLVFMLDHDIMTSYSWRIGLQPSWAADRLGNAHGICIGTVKVIVIIMNIIIVTVG